MVATIGQQIKRYRTQAGLTQADLAELIGITHSAISLIEADKRGVTIDKLRKICDALGCIITDIIEQ